MAASVNAAGVAKHYTKGGKLIQRLTASFLAAGIDVKTSVKTTDLDPVDEFHLGGRGTAEKLFDLLSLPEDKGEGALKLLDIGAGLGGPARIVADRYAKAHVTGIDLTPDYVDAANSISKWPGIELAERCTFQTGDAIALDESFAEGTFDAA